jgi:hypothetical protein
MDIFAYPRYNTCMGRLAEVSERALYARINRALKQTGTGETGRALRTSRSARMESSVGHYYVLDLDRNFIVRQRVDLIELARELKVLAPWEKLEKAS